MSPPSAQAAVVDSSVIVKWVDRSREKLLKQAESVLEDGVNGHLHLLAPDLSWYEVGNVLVNKGLSAERAKTALTFLYSLPLEFVPMSLDVAENTYVFAKRFRITYYDAAFAALAAEMGALLITDNVKHQGQVKGIQVVPLEEYS